MIVFFVNDVDIQLFAQSLSNFFVVMLFFLLDQMKCFCVFNRNVNIRERI